MKSNVEIVDAVVTPEQRSEAIATMAQFLGREASDREAARQRAIPALGLIMDSIRNHGGTGQVDRLERFLAGLYNGPRFPFDLTELRSLDRRLADACLAVLDYDRYCAAEIHHWGIVDAEELNQHFLRGGHYYGAQERRIARELYAAKFGPDGHQDEGLTG